MQYIVYVWCEVMLHAVTTINDTIFGKNCLVPKHLRGSIMSKLGYRSLFIILQFPGLFNVFSILIFAILPLHFINKLIIIIVWATTKQLIWYPSTINLVLWNLNNMPESFVTHKWQFYHWFTSPLIANTAICFYY